MNQIRSNPKQNNNHIIDYCKRFGIQVTAYSPLGGGGLIKDPTLTEIGNRHNKTTAQVMIRWHLQRGVVAIPKSTKTERIRDNFNVWDFSLTEDDMKTINSMNSSGRRSVSHCFDFVYYFFSIIQKLIKYSFILNLRLRLESQPLQPLESLALEGLSLKNEHLDYFTDSPS